VKGDRRYRYYVSRSLMKGSATRVDGGWRLPAAEIERSVAAAAQSILDDQQTVISAIEEGGLDSSRIAPLLKSAAARSERLRFEQDNALSSLIDRVDLGRDGMRLSIKLPLSNTGAPDGSSHLSIKRHVPMQIRRRGIELRLVVSVKGPFGRAFPVAHDEEQRRGQNYKSCADAPPLTACMKEKLSHGRQPKESHSVEQGGRQPPRDAR
jgi:hypothetical protein